MASPRTIARLEAQIKRRAAHCLQFEVSDPRSAFLTITRVELSSDIQFGKIFYSILGDESDKSRTAHMLESAGGFIQRQIGSVLDIRHVPRLSWHYDDTLERVDETESSKGDEARALLELCRTLAVDRAG